MQEPWAQVLGGTIAGSLHDTLQVATMRDGESGKRFPNYSCMFPDELWQVFRQEAGGGAEGDGCPKLTAQSLAPERLMAHNRMNHLGNPALTPSPPRQPPHSFRATLSAP